MKVKRVLLALAVGGLMWGSLGSPAAAGGHDNFTWRNPTQPSKSPDDLKDSQYRGWHFEAKYEPFRRCILARESGGNYRSDGPWGSGGYQFIQSTWDRAMKYAGYPEWVGVRPYLAPVYVQQEGFWVTANPYPKKSGLRGAHHWSTDHTYAELGVRGVNCEKELPGGK